MDPVILSIGSQSREMARLWPQLAESGKTIFSCYWTGPLATRMKAYDVQIRYIKPHKLTIGRILPALAVTVITPLKLHPDSAQLPHIYQNKNAPNGGEICLYYPADEGGWDFTQLIARKIVPWLSEWLLFYEGWLVTGEWFADGVEPYDLEHQKWVQDNKQRPSEDPTVPFRHAADLYIGKEKGTFGSLPLMAAASKGSSRPLSWLDWKELI